MLRHDYTLLCEHARIEIGGKWIIIGLFTNGIATPQIPFPLPMLTFFQALYTDAPGNYKFTARLTELTTGNLLAQAAGGVNAQAAGPVIFPIALPNLQFKAFGTYIWSLDVEGQPDPFLTQFNVALVQPQMLMMPPQPPQPKKPN